MNARLTHDLTIEYVPLTELSTYPGNARVGDVDAIAESMDENGIFDAIVVQRSTGYVLDGNHRYLAMQQLGEDRAPVIWVDVDDERAKRIVLVANRTNDLATYDDAALIALLTSLPDLTATGFDDDALAALIDDFNDLDLDGDHYDDGTEGDSGDAEHDPDGEDADHEADPNKGAALEMWGDAIVGDPDLMPANGTVWQLGDHMLFVADVHSGWPVYGKHITEGHLFWPYPSLLAPFTSKAKNTPVIMVQPNNYLAGWLITKWQRVTGKTATEVPQ